MHVRRDRVGEDLEAVDEPRPRAAEVGVAVRHVDAAGADRRQRVEAGLPRQDRQIAARPRHVEAAAGDQQDLGIGGADVVPGDRARARAGDAEQRLAAGERDQLGRPVAGAERRIDPFEHGDGGGRLHARGTRRHGVDAGPQRGDHLASARRDAGRFRDEAEAGEDILEARRLEVHDARRPGQRARGFAHLGVGDGADVAQRLGDDQIRAPAPRARAGRACRAPAASSAARGPARRSRRWPRRGGSACA